MSTKIEWTHIPLPDGTRKKGETTNPQIGCREKSPGCSNCYAAKQAAREMSAQHRGLTRSLPLLDSDGNQVIGKDGRPKIKPNSTHWNGQIRRVPEQLDKVLRWRDPRGIFWGSMTDLFIRDNLDSAEGRRFLAACFGVMAATPQHTHMVLTKRPHLMRKWLDWLNGEAESIGAYAKSRGPVGETILDMISVIDGPVPEYVISAVRRIQMWPKWPLPNVWLGTTTEDQRRADERIPELLATPAAARFLSCEPLLGPVTIPDEFLALGKRGWVIVGGESGPGARPMHPAWVRSIVKQCSDAGLPAFMKQWGAFVPVADDTWTHVVTLDGRSYKRGKDTPLAVFADPDTAYMRRCSKHDGGREIDGRTWDEFPEV